MNLDKYYIYINSFSEEYLNNDHENLINFVNILYKNSINAKLCVDFRKKISTADEYTSMNNKYEFGYFSEEDELTLKTWWIFLFDINYRICNLIHENICKKYNKNQNLFINEPNLWNSIRLKKNGTKNEQFDLELIDERKILCPDNNEIYQIENGFTVIASMLNSSIAKWARENYPFSPNYIKLDPNKWYKEKPCAKINKTTIVPIDKRWINNLSHQKFDKTFARYEILKNVSYQDNMEQYKDYNLRNIRRLEIYAKRNLDYLSMTIEELPKEDDPSGIMIGKCIHLDTTSPAGTPIKNAQIGHIDLAINAYTGSDRNTRFNNDLRNKQKCKASYRTHLYRIENIPFIELFKICEMFLNSHTLLNEWLLELND